MKILNLEAFRELPVGVVAMKYEPCIFGDLFVKDETWERDFLLQYITNETKDTDSEDRAEKLFMAENFGESVKMDFDVTTRDGLFEENQLFAVWGKEDVEGLITKLTGCLEAYDNE